MSWLNNLKIVYKIALIVALLSMVTIGAVGFASLQMKEAGAAYSDVINRVDMSSVVNVRAARIAERYVSHVYQIVASASESENARLAAEVTESHKVFDQRIALVRKNLPEKEAVVDNVISEFNKGFVACDAVAAFAAKATSREDSIKASARMETECNVPIQNALAVQTKMTEELIAYSANESARLGRQLDSTIVTVLLVSGLGTIMGLALAAFIGIKGLAQPIGRLKVVMEAFAGNDLKGGVPGVQRRDELGEMARTVEIFKTNGLEVERLKVQQFVAEQQSAAQRKADMHRLAEEFEGAVGEIIQTVSSAATELEASANTLTATASRTEELSTVVASAAEEASTNVQSVASASEEMASSVNEIGRQVQDSARMAGDAVSQAQATNDRVLELSRAANKIGDVVELINTIAGQTNLLALNATIEAARAGDAGRGFAVVASEVKSLAEQTAKATGEIAEQVKGIQTATADSVEAIKAIGITIGRMSEISATIASAVEEQGAATQEISRNVQQASQGTSQVASNIVDVQRGSSETGSASSQVLSSAQSLSVESTRLKTEVAKFLATVRAA